MDKPATPCMPFCVPPTTVPASTERLSLPKVVSWAWISMSACMQECTVVRQGARGVERGGCAGHASDQKGMHQKSCAGHASDNKARAGRLAYSPVLNQPAAEAYPVQRRICC